jgi:hypothetical protein
VPQDAATSLGIGLTPTLTLDKRAQAWLMAKPRIGNHMAVGERTLATASSQPP